MTLCIVAAALVILWIVCRVPSGYEDETEFHSVDYCEQPRCDITGQPITYRQRFEQDTGIY